MLAYVAILKPKMDVCILISHRSNVTIESFLDSIRSKPHIGQSRCVYKSMWTMGVKIVNSVIISDEEEEEKKNC